MKSASNCLSKDVNYWIGSEGCHIKMVPRWLNTADRNAAKYLLLVSFSLIFY